MESSAKGAFLFLPLRGRLLCRFRIGHLLGLPGRSSLEAGLGPPLPGVGLIGQRLLLVLDGLHVVDGLHQHALVLELVPLGQHVQAVEDVLVDLLRVAHLLQEATENALAAHPQYLEGETRVRCTSALTSTCLRFRKTSNETLETLVFFLNVVT
jgi:hypothetical protein